MKSTHIQIIIVLLFVFNLNNVIAQRIEYEEQNEQRQEEKPNKFDEEQDRIKDPDLKHHERIRPPNEREIETRKLSPGEIEQIKPVWVCASNQTYSSNDFAHKEYFDMQIFNFSYELVFIRVILYSKDGKVEHVFENKLEGKHTWDLGSKIYYNISEGPIEIYASSKAIYPQAVFFKRLGGYYDAVNDDMDSEFGYSACLQWFRVDH